MVVGLSGWWEWGETLKGFSQTILISVPFILSSAMDGCFRLS